MRELVPGKISPATARRVAGLVLRAGLILPEAWGSRLDETRESGVSAQSDDSVLLDIAISVAREDAFIHQKISQALQTLPFRESRLLAAVSDGLGAPQAAGTEKKQAYGKFNPLTGVYNYVMPSSVAYDFLVRGGESKIPGQVILSSAVALQGAEPGDVYPGILGRVLAGYESVGLHHEARKLAVEAILGLLK